MGLYCIYIYIDHIQSKVLRSDYFLFACGYNGEIGMIFGVAKQFGTTTAKALGFIQRLFSARPAGRSVGCSWHLMGWFLLLSADCFLQEMSGVSPAEESGLPCKTGAAGQTLGTGPLAAPRGEPGFARLKVHKALQACVSAQGGCRFAYAKGMHSLMRATTRRGSCISGSQICWRLRMS